MEEFISLEDAIKSKPIIKELFALDMKNSLDGLDFLKARKNNKNYRFNFFISISMYGYSNEVIAKQIKEAEEYYAKELDKRNMKYSFITNFNSQYNFDEFNKLYKDIKDEDQIEDMLRITRLGQAIGKLGLCDAMILIINNPTNYESKGCKIEHDVANTYCIEKLNFCNTGYYGDYFK